MIFSCAVSAQLGLYFLTTVLLNVFNKNKEDCVNYTQENGSLKEAYRRTVRKVDLCCKVFKANYFQCF